MSWTMLPPLPEIPEIHRRLQIIFPEGTPRRGYCTREMAARTIFVMLYIGAVEGSGVWLAPRHVYRMGESQSRRREDTERRAWLNSIRERGFVTPPDRWFQDNAREPIRDETLREGLVQANAVATRAGVSTTSSEGRYALRIGFAALLDPALADEPLEAAITMWQDRSLSAGALARIRLHQRSAMAARSKIQVTLPNGETRQMEAGLSSVITKAVIEVFARRFLGDPAVLWISESGKKVVQRDDDLARSLGLGIESDTLLPDIILVDLAPAEPLVIFVEAVATDGPITESRRVALLDLVTAAGFEARQIAFVSAFQDRNARAFKKALPDLAWGSFAWCLSESDHLIAFDGTMSRGVGFLSEFAVKIEIPQ